MKIDELFAPSEHEKEEIAIIGIDCTFGAYNGPEEVWNLIKGNKNAFSEIPEQRELQANLSYQTSKNKYIPIAYMTDIDSFDYEFFNIPKLEARLMDPRQRLFLQSAWRAIEDSGYNPLDIQRTNMGVFLGLSNDGGNDYFQLIKKYEPEMVGMATTGNIQSMIASRISYLLNLSGPALVMDTACSSSMVALHTACQSILNRDCESAIVGGVNLKILPKVDEINAVDIGNVSKDHQVHTFDEAASGTNSGEGVAAIIIKKLSEAIHDQDHIYAVIKSTAINQDGKSNGIAAPNGTAQEAVISKAWENAGIRPEDISFIEAHGTGTKLGDPIEFEALSSVGNRYSTQKNFIPISSFKTNIGHLDSLSGLAGIVKASLCIKNRIIPAGRNFVSPNASIDFLSSPLYVSTKVKAYEKNQKMVAAISSFGLSGTNAHVVMEGYEENNIPASEDLKSYPFIFSATSEAALIHYLGKFREFTENTKFLLADISYSLNFNRRQCKYRVGIVVDSLSMLNQKLDLILNKGLHQSGEKAIVYGQVDNIKGSLVEYLNEFPYLATQADKAWSPLQIVQEFCCCKYLDLRSYYLNNGYRKVNIPTYHFSGSHLWINLPALQDRFYHPIIGHEVSRTNEEIIYQNILSAKSHWILAEHRVKGNSVVPGTAYIDAAFAVGKQEFGHLKDFTVQKVNFYSLLNINGKQQKEIESRVVKTSIGFQMTVFSRNKGDKDWQKNVELDLKPASNSSSKHYDISDLIQTMEKRYILTKGETTIPLSSSKDSSFKQIVIDEESSRKSIIKLGKHWDTSLEAYSRSYAVLCRLGLNDILQSECAQYLFHPSLMDCAVNSGTFIDGAGFYLPYYYKDIQLLAPIPKEFYVYINLKKTPSKELKKFDVQVISLEGELLCKISDYIVKRMSENSENLYKINWEATSLPQVANVTNTSYLFLGDGNKRLITELSKISNSVTFIESEENVEKIKQRIATWLKGSKNQRIILSFSASKSLEATKTFYELAQAIAQLRLEDNKFSLSVITIAGNFVNDKKCEINTYENLKSAIGKVLAKEVFSNSIQLIDTDEETNQKFIINELLSENESYYVAFRKNKRYHQVLTQLESPQKSYEIKKGIYLVTGGLGGIGQHIVKSLMSSRSTIIAIGRRSADDLAESIANIEQLAFRENSKFIYYQADISKESEITPLIEKVKNLYGDITGIFHTAGIVAGGYIHSLSYSQYLKNIAAKVQGTNNLYELTKGLKLEFFVNFSSINSLIGAVGQVDYVSANAYLDAFSYKAVQSRYSVLQATKYLTINWSGWMQTGLTKEENSYGQYDKGFKDFIPDQAIHELYYAMAAEENRIIVGEIDPKLSKAFSAMKGISIAPDILNKMKQNQSRLLVEDNSFKELVEVNQNSKDRGDIEKEVKKVWEKIFDFEIIDGGSKFSELGGDSILAAYLLKELDKHFPDVLDISDIFSYPTISSMANYIWSETHKKADYKGQKYEKLAENTNWDTLLKSLQAGIIKPDDIKTLKGVR